MAIRAICVRCGKPKRRALAACRACGFEPETEYQIARALIFAATTTVGGVAVGRDAETLKALASQTQAGRFYEFDPNEERRVVEAYARQRTADRARRRARRRVLLWAVSLAVVAALGALIHRAGA